MAIIASRKSSLLGSTYVLAPERYDPRRSLDASSSSIPLGDVVKLIRKTVSPKGDLGSCIVLDTSDVREGIVIGRKEQTTEIGSAKKTAQPGDMIISRLRPYLRQVAYVDHRIANLSGALLVCSTEFFVLRAKDEQSIAFLVPFLLSDRVQEVLAASQEGGHHPRFDDATLMNLPLPKKILKDREKISKSIEAAVEHYREAEQSIEKHVKLASAIMESKK